MKSPTRYINNNTSIAGGAVFIVIFVLTLLAAAPAAAKKPSGITSSQEATDIWHSYEIQSNYKYYYSGPDSQPNYIIGIDDRYRLTSGLWKPVDLTPGKLEGWINYRRPRVGYSPRLYGAEITDKDGRRIGLWYSVRDWRLLGTATVRENNQVVVTRPAVGTARREESFFCAY